VEYLLVQRKDSLCFVEFVRGKYDLWNGDYLLYLFSHMTTDEREQLLDMSFADIWRRLWAHKMGNRSFLKEFEQCQGKFECLRVGVAMSFASRGSVFTTLRDLLATAPHTMQEREWGFPKGRRNLNEGDLNCALREFQEETGISRGDVELVDMPSLEEVFTGCNGVRYRHVYYTATLLATGNTECNASECETRLEAGREIQCTAWFDADSVLCKIPAHNWERRQLFCYADDVLCHRRLPPCVPLCFGKNLCCDHNKDGAWVHPDVPPPPPPPHASLSRAFPETRTEDAAQTTDNSWMRCRTRRFEDSCRSWLKASSKEPTTTRA
jgi:8-oxo-dGTP pyrophosphatase MutT (NUDIX family)